MTHVHAALRHASDRPDSLAFQQGELRTSYGALQARADQLTVWLMAHGVQRGDRVILWTPSCAEMASALLATWAVGALAVLVDPNSHADTYRHVYGAVSPKVVWHLESAAPPATLGAEQCLDACHPDAPLHYRPRPPLPTEPASILFTSGSTGLPKGVVQSHGNLARGARAVAASMGLSERDRLLCPVPWSFDYGFVNLQLTLLHGLPHYLPPAGGGPFGIAKAVEAVRPTVFVGVPAVLPFAIPALKGAGGASLRAITNTGGAIPAKLQERIFADLPRADLYLNYGLTESYRTSLLDPSLARSHPTSVGRAIAGVEVVLLDDDYQLVAPGELGQIVHRGDYLFLGYWGDPDTTAQKLRDDPLALPQQPHAAKVLFTGDQGVFDDEGLLYFKGRGDRQLKSMGVRVSPDEVEAILRHEAGWITDVGVYGRPHETLGHEICAAVVVEGPEAAEPIKALRALAKRLPAHLGPRRWAVLPSLPRTHTGKVDYQALLRGTDEA